MQIDDKIGIFGAARTPIGRFQGAMSGFDATVLGATAIRAALDRSGVDPDLVQYTIMGNVLSAGLGQAPARQAALRAGVPGTTSALTVNKVCASGMMAVVLGTQMIRSGDLDVVAVGGMESMSRAPHVLSGSREGKRFGNWDMFDSMIQDGLWCALNDVSMGDLAEGTAKKFHISRYDQDLFSVSSHQRAIDATDNGRFRKEIVPLSLTTDKVVNQIETDEGPRLDSSLEDLSNIRPAFPPGETVTAGNSAQISDGAAALIIGNESHQEYFGVGPMAFIDDYVFVANNPEDLFEAPAMAIDKLLRRGGISIDHVDLLEVNEAFAAQMLANGKVLDWDWAKVNVNGGAVALGHPIGATGARMLVTLVHALIQNGLGQGIAALCHGGGGAVAMRVSRI